jgi:hypothetical protein
MTENATIRTVEHGEASRLPEPTWFWRRWLIYGVTVWAMVILSVSTNAVLDVARDNAISQGQLAALGTHGLIIRYSFYTAWMAVLLYGVGASVTDVAAFVAAVRTTRKETITTAPQPASLRVADAAIDSPPQPDPAPLTPRGVDADSAPWDRPR